MQGLVPYDVVNIPGCFPLPFKILTPLVFKLTRLQFGTYRLLKLWIFIITLSVYALLHHSLLLVRTELSNPQLISSGVWCNIFPCCIFEAVDLCCVATVLSRIILFSFPFEITCLLNNLQMSIYMNGLD